MKAIATTLLATVLALPVSLEPASEAKAAKVRACHLEQADSAVFGIKLADSESVKRIIGTQYRHQSDGSDLPWAHFMSRDGAQMFSMRHHAGDIMDSHMEFNVRYAGKSIVEQVLPTNAFVTDRDIRLGVTRAFVIARFGTCFKVTENRGGLQTIRYENKDFENSTFLKKRNMPLYYAEYQFRGGKLIRFQFGFEYP